MATNPKTKRIEAAAINYSRAARIAGCPPDQIDIFFSSGYIAQERQLEFHAAARECDQPGGPNQVGFGGARGPGKSHALFAQIALDDCQRFSDLKVLYLRKIAKNAKEQFDDLRRSVLAFTPHKYSAHVGVIRFPNNSRIIVGHFKNESDVDSYLGLEYDIICIEEATTLTESKYKTLRDSNRTSKDGFRPRIYASTNPGGIGHAWFKKRFILPARSNKQSETRFIFATVEDNKFVDSGYKKKLEENTGWKLQAYRFGNWDVFAGQFFTNFNHDLHVFNPKSLPNPKEFGLDVWASLDYGFKHFTSAHLFTKYDGDIIVLDEYGARLQLVKSNADGIKQMLARWSLAPEDLLTFVAGTDVFAKKGDSGTSYADEFAENGIYLRPANTNRTQGAGRILQLLGDKEQQIAPSVKISKSCRKLIETLPMMEHDPNRPDDVLKVDVDEDGNGGDDFYDDFRYGVMASGVNISIG